MKEEINFRKHMQNFFKDNVGRCRSAFLRGWAVQLRQAGVGGRAGERRRAARALRAVDEARRKALIGILHQLVVRRREVEWLPGPCPVVAGEVQAQPHPPARPLPLARSGFATTIDPSFAALPMPPS